MTIDEHQELFFGKKVVEFQPDEALLSLDAHVYRLTVDYDDDISLQELLQQFLERVEPAALDAIIFGMWSDAYDEAPQPIINELITHKDALPALKAMFFGDMTYEECEISWITQGSYKPLLDAFPQLQHLQIRGSNDLLLEPFQHENLQTLIIECGGLPHEIVNNLAQSSLPALKHLELWLGTEDYGFSGSVADYAAMLTVLNPAQLSYLGLRNAEIADEVAIYLAQQPWVAELDTLDLSKGCMTDKGAEALFNSPYVKALAMLDLSYHYISPAWVAKLQTLPITVIIDAPQEADEDDGEVYRYVEVGE